MLKRLLSCSIVAIVGLALCSGCSNDAEDVCTADDVQTMLTSYLSQDYSVCADCYFQVSYNNMSAEEQQEVVALMQNTTVTSVEAEDDTTFSVTLSVPSADGMLKTAMSDSGFVSDFQNADLSADENAHSVVVASYLTSLLQQGVTKVEERTLDVTVEGSQLKDDSMLVKVFDSFLNYDGVSYVSSQLSAVEGTEQTEATVSTELPVVDSDKVFMFQQNGARFMVHDICVLQSTDAVKRVQELSTANASISTTDSVYFVSYKVKNLSNASVQVADCFKLVNGDGLLLENSGSYVTGLVQAATVNAGEDVELTTFLVGSKDAKLIWYSAENTLGCYVLNIVQ